ncbi:MAG: hypothetical protein ACR2RV_25430 [Verrucomicrobiales bacterium]
MSVAPPAPAPPPLGTVDPAPITEIIEVTEIAEVTEVTEVEVADIASATAEIVAEPDPPKPSKPKRAKRIKKQKKAKATKPKKIKRPRAPFFPFLRVAVPGAITLAALLGGAYYGWENYFKPVEQPKRTIYQEITPPTFSTAEVSAPDILRFLPQEAELAAYIDARAGFDIWSATMNPKGEPVYNPVDEFVRDSAGVGLEQLDYLCFAGDAGLENFVAVVGFNTELDPAALYSGIERTGSRLVRVETIGQKPLRILHRDGIDFELLMVDSKTVLFTSPGRMRSAVEAGEPRTAKPGSALSSLERSVSGNATFALAGTPETIGAGQIFEAIGCPAPVPFLNHINNMGAVGISATAHNDIEVSLTFSATDPQQGAGLRETGAAWLKQVPQKVRDGFGKSFPGGILPLAIDRMLESARWEGDGSASSIRISIPRHDIPDLFRAFEPRAEDQAAANRALRDAQNLASLFASGVSCGNTDLPKAGSVDAALELLISGVEGSGDFAETKIRFPFRPDDIELQAISRHLQWQDNLLVCVPAQ